MILVLLALAFLVAFCAYKASRCPVVRIVAKLFSANAERHRQARFQL